MKVLLTVDDVAGILNLSPREVRRRAADGRIPKPDHAGMECLWLACRFRKSLADALVASALAGWPSGETDARSPHVERAE
jgi:hypothetical protein